MRRPRERRQLRAVVAGDSGWWPRRLQLWNGAAAYHGVHHLPCGVKYNFSNLFFVSGRTRNSYLPPSAANRTRTAQVFSVLGQAHFVRRFLCVSRVRYVACSVASHACIGSVEPYQTNEYDMHAQVGTCTYVRALISCIGFFFLLIARIRKPTFPLFPFSFSGLGFFFTIYFYFSIFCFLFHFIFHFYVTFISTFSKQFLFTYHVLLIFWYLKLLIRSTVVSIDLL